MSASFSKKSLRPEQGIALHRRIVAAVALPSWVFLTFMLAQLLLGLALYGLSALGVSLSGVNEALVNTSIGVVVYGLTILLCFGIPWLIMRRRVTLEVLGLGRLPSWGDIGLAPLGFIVYFTLTYILLLIAQNVLTGVDFNQSQDVGFEQLSSRFEYLLAFFMLVVIAPFAEELLFRGYLFGQLRRFVVLPVAILITSLLFGFVHGQWNTGIDTFALSIVLCLLVVVSKSLWPAVLLHSLKNAVAFYFLFINPVL